MTDENPLEKPQFILSNSTEEVDTIAEKVGKQVASFQKDNQTFLENRESKKRKNLHNNNNRLKRTGNASETESDYFTGGDTDTDLESKTPEWLLSKNKPIKLSDTWVFWYDDNSTRTSSSNWEDSLRNLGEFHTVQKFWKYWSVFENPLRFTDGTYLRMFRKKIEPKWEDPENTKGGHWIFPLQKHLTPSFWASLVLAMIGNQFDPAEALNGIVLSIKGRGDVIQVWGKSSDPKDLQKITNQFKEMFPSFPEPKYQYHQKKIHDTVPTLNKKKSWGDRAENGFISSDDSLSDKESLKKNYFDSSNWLKKPTTHTQKTIAKQIQEEQNNPKNEFKYRNNSSKNFQKKSNSFTKKTPNQNNNSQIIEDINIPNENEKSISAQKVIYDSNLSETEDHFRKEKEEKETKKVPRKIKAEKKERKKKVKKTSSKLDDLIWHPNTPLFLLVLVAIIYFYHVSN